MFKSLKAQLTAHSWIAFLLILVLVSVEAGRLVSTTPETGHPVSAAPDIEQLINSSIKNQFVQAYDDKLASEMTEILRQTGMFAESLKSGLIAEDYTAHILFYVKVKVDLGVLGTLVDAEGAGSPNADLMRKALALLNKAVQDWETVDQMRQKISSAYVSETYNILKAKVSSLMASVYTARSGPRQ